MSRIGANKTCSRTINLDGVKTGKNRKPAFKQIFPILLS